MNEIKETTMQKAERLRQEAKALEEQAVEEERLAEEKRKAKAKAEAEKQLARDHAYYEKFLKNRASMKDVIEYVERRFRLNRDNYSVSDLTSEEIKQATMPIVLEIRDSK